MKHAKLKDKVQKAQSVILEAASKYPKEEIVVAWTGGKDSTVLLHLVRSIFQGQVPFPVMFNDSTMEFEEVYDFIKRITEEWNLKIAVVPHSKKELEEFHKTKDKARKKELSRIMKVSAIRAFTRKHHVAAFVAGIRWDEHPSRSKEQYFSQRPDHVRVHPILHFTEKDIWDYIKHYKVPYVALYDQGYRSLGEKPFTNKAIAGEGERSGREKDKEHLMDKLRNIGYW
jgi:phosphoadenosine phosphosulfate reductase